MKPVLYFFVILILTHCSINQKKIQITLINNSEKRIDSFVITSFQLNLKYSKLQLGDNKTVTTIVEKRNYEGSFLTKLYVKDSLVKVSQFGYFSGFNDVRNKYVVTINKDLSISEIFK